MLSCASESRYRSPSLITCQSVLCPKRNAAQLRRSQKDNTDAVVSTWQFWYLAQKHKDVQRWVKCSVDVGPTQANTKASLTIRMQCGPHRHRCLQSLSKKNKSHRRAASKHCRRSPRCGHGHYAASFAAIASDATVRDCSCQQECQLIWTFLPDVLLSCPMYYNNRCSRAQSWLSGSYAGMVPSYHVNSTWLQTRGPKRALPFVLVLLRYPYLCLLTINYQRVSTPNDMSPEFAERLQEARL